MTTKHIVDNPHDLVLDSLKGLIASDPKLELDVDYKVLYKPKAERLAIITGGGSGHEPAHAGFVGDGLLSAAVCGNIFASPNVEQIQRAIEIADAQATEGVLVVVKNYTGDVLNFGLAVEQQRAKLVAEGRNGNRLCMLIVGDDVAVGRKQGAIVGRRGLAGTTLVYKIAGAMAEEGCTFVDVFKTAEYVASRLGTVGVGLDHCHIPGTATPDHHLAFDEAEVGMGIHNEPGTMRIKLESRTVLIRRMLDLITNTQATDRAFLPFANDGTDEVVLMVNNLGSVSQLELGAIVADTVKALQDTGIAVDRVTSGTFMTSLNMPGFSLTLLLLPKTGDLIDKAAILGWLDTPVEPAAWNTFSTPPVSIDSAMRTATRKPQISFGGLRIRQESLKAQDPTHFIHAIRRACLALIDAEPDITRQDLIAGDGDAGLTLRSGSLAVLEAIQNGSISGDDVVADIAAISDAVKKSMGGTSGALYAIFFSALQTGLLEAAGAQETVTRQIWSTATETALRTLYKYTRARPPSRTLVDPLDAFVNCLWSKTFAEAAQTAFIAAKKTSELVAKAGRGAYIDQEELKRQNTPDPGAWGVWKILEALSEDWKD